jgi:hypothetical protein
MQKTFRFAASPLLALLFGLSSLAVAQQAGDNFHWTGTLPANGVVQIKNINGAIEADAASGNTIEVSAVKTGPDRDQVKIDVVKTADSVTICTVYPGGSCTADSGSHTHGDYKAKVDYTVRVPRNLRFTGSNVNGAIRAQNMGRPVKAATVNGAIDASSSSWVSATSVNGAVRVSMGSADWDGRLKISTVNGSVTLDLPSDTNAEVHFSSVNGSLTSDFPLTVQGGIMGFGPKHIEGTIGKGGRELDVQTVNGTLAIHKGKATL